MANQSLKVIDNIQKQMPCNIEAEQAVIGSILVSNEIYDEITPILDAKKFLGLKIFFKNIFKLFLKLVHNFW